jgi:hypothetical protein
MTNLILVCISILIFVVYNWVTIHKYGLPPSLSDSYYDLESTKKGLGWLFTGMMWAFSLLLLPAWLNITEVISDWSHYFTVLPFLTVAFICGVGTAPHFRDRGLVETVHMFCAKAAAVTALLWICVVCWKIAYILPIMLGVCWGIAYLTKTNKTSRDWWWEMVAFSSLFITVFVETLCLFLGVHIY